MVSAPPGRGTIGGLTPRESYMLFALASMGVVVSPNAAILYVQSTHPAAGIGKDGRDPNNPLSTIDEAVSLCVANRGDVIVCLPGHVETVSAAAGLDLDVAGITVVGIGEGTDQPQVVLDTVITADVDIDAANVTVIGMHFVAAFADITAAIDLNATDATFRRCRFSEQAAGENALIWLVTAGASHRLTVEDCEAIALDAANTHFINFAGTPAGCIVRNNVLHGDWGTAAIGGTGVVTSCRVIDNLIANEASDVDSCINFAATATGIVKGNHCAGAAAQANGVTATAMLVSQNFYGVISEDLSAILDPIAT